MSEANVASVQAQIDNNPALQAYFKSRQGGLRHQKGDPRGDLPQLLASQGIQIPHDWVMSSGDGKLYEKNFWSRNPWVGPVIMAGIGGLGVASAAGAFGGAAGSAGAAGAGGVGLGETGAVTGLAGSGFGGAGAAGAVGAGAAGAGGAATGAAGGLGGILPALLKAGGPAALMALTRARGGNQDPFLSQPGNAGGMGGGGELDSQLAELMDFSKRRMQQSEPVHEAAMQLAMRMAPGTAGYGRVREASQNAMTPTPRPTMNPNVAEAYQRLMNRGGR